MARIDIVYHEILDYILNTGYEYEDPNRKGVKRLQVDDCRIVHLFKNGFPAITTRKTYFNLAVGELLAFLSGAKYLKDLHKFGINFWDKDAYNFYLQQCSKENWTPLSFEDWLNEVKREINWTDSGVKHRNCGGDLGRIYPYQMRSWNGEVDQLLELIKTLRENPMATKKTVTMWNPSDLEDSALSPCHFMFQAVVTPLTKYQRMDICSMDFFVEPEEELLDSLRVPKYGLKIKFSMHSVDTFLGLPSNLQYYSVLCYFLARLSGMEPLGVIADLTNVHLYDNQIAAAKEQLTRSTETHPNCELELSKNFNYLIDKFLGAKEDLMSDPLNKWNESEALTNLINNLSTDNFKLKGYESYPPIKVEMLTYNK